MKGITVGKDERNQRVTCEHCKKDFVFEEKDLKLLHACKDYKLFGVKCPCCDKNYLIRDWELSFKVTT